ncbi:MAG: T9SS type A sorting domain-containing protein [Saprospiraceae bacterium]|nr:T9SS type A sorting domain-containing protein [Saprospiraceae bacterium]
MKHLSTLLLMFAVAGQALFSQNTNQIRISFEHKAGAGPMSIDHTVFPIWNNKNVKITRAEFYISEVEILHSDFGPTLLADQYLLVDASDPLVEFNLGTWPVDVAQGVTLHLGVPPAVNHLDPTTYPAGHPLAPQNPTMHWGWAAGYRFMAIEGKVDNNNDGVPETIFEFHNVGDELYKAVELTGVETAENGVLHLHFILDYAKLFTNMTMNGNPVHHGNTTMNVSMMNNSANEGFITMPVASSADEVDFNSRKVSASPNPFSTETFIRYELPAAASLDLVVTNALGQPVFSLGELPAAGTIRIEKGNLPAGVYQYAFFENKHLMARKQFIISE